MKQTTTLAAAVTVCLASGAPLLAEQAPLGTKRPKILQIFREEVRPGKGPAHEKNEMGWPAALRKAGDKSYYLAMSSGTEAWFVTPRDSFAAAEGAQKESEANAALTAELDRLWAIDGEMLTKTSGFTAVHRGELSYRPDWDTAKMRYYRVTTFRLNPGYGRDFEQVRKAINDAHDKAKMDEHWAIYEVVAGAPGGTYLILQPMASLAEWDKVEEMHGKAYQDALGDVNQDRIRDFQRAAVKSTETQLFSFSPKMSYLPKEMSDRDPDFWTPKPAPAAAKKEEKK